MRRVGAAILAAALLLIGPATANAGEGPARQRQSVLDADRVLTKSSGNWASPRCVGDGAAGPRVQPVFVHRAGHPNRFPDFEGVLRRSLALTTGIYERSSRGTRTIRWVHGVDCRPIIRVVAVPAPVSHRLAPMRTWLQANVRGFGRSDRVYALWVDGITGWGWSGLGGDRWSATWSSSGGFVWADAHELTHALGAVSNRAPHATGRGHCWDATDVMCYRDGGAGWRDAATCEQAGNNYRLDCGGDDYFNLRPRPGTWLARNPTANVARSRFLAVVRPQPYPRVPDPPVGVAVSDGPDGRQVTWRTRSGTRYDVWTDDPATVRVRWLGMGLPGPPVSLPSTGGREKLMVRAITDAGYSDPVVIRPGR